MSLSISVAQTALNNLLLQQQANATAINGIINVFNVLQASGETTIPDYFATTYGTFFNSYVASEVGAGITLNLLIADLNSKLT